MNSIRKVIILGVSFLALSANSARAGTGDNSQVPLGKYSTHVDAPGISLDSFNNSLTDLNGLLRSFQPAASGDVKFTGSEINANQITMHAKYHMLIWLDEVVKGSLSVRDLPSTASCAGAGKELDFNVSGSRKVRTIVFQICATTPKAGTGLDVSINQYIVAGPDYVSAVKDIASTIFMQTPTAIERHAVSYLTGLSSGTPTGAATQVAPAPAAI